MRLSISFSRGPVGGGPLFYFLTSESYNVSDLTCTMFSLVCTMCELCREVHETVLPESTVKREIGSMGSSEVNETPRKSSVLHSAGLLSMSIRRRNQRLYETLVGMGLYVRFITRKDNPKMH